MVRYELELLRELGAGEPVISRLIIYVLKFSCMKPIKLIVLFPVFLFLSGISVSGQSTWTLTKNKDGIAVYQSPSANSAYKSIKVECTLEGNYDKLIAVITKPAEYKNWVYNNKTASIVKTVSPSDFYYYTETTLPWPMSNRDVVMHTVITRDGNDKFLKISSTDHTGLVTEKSGKVRVQNSNINWHVTRPTATTIHIVYTFEADPGGSIPAWMVNSFADKGPFESFKKLAALLKS